MKTLFLIIFLSLNIFAQNKLLLLMGDSEKLTLLYSDYFTSDITGWSGAGSGVAHYSSDWNSIGRVGVLRDSATATSNARFYVSQAMTAGNTYRVKYDYYLPSTNTDCNEIRIYLSGAQSIELTNNTTTNTWVSTTEDFTPLVNYTLLLFQAEGGGNITIGDKIYIDNVELYLVE